MDNCSSSYSLFTCQRNEQIPTRN